MGAEIDAETQERALVDGAGLIDGRDRGSVLVTGPDAPSFLHNLLSQDVAGLGPGEGAHALLLQPQGKLDCDLRLLVVGPEEIRLDCEAGRGEGLAASLRRFKLRVKAEVEDTTGSWAGLLLRGRRAPAVVEEAAGVAPPSAAHQHIPWPDRSGVRIVRADWPGGWAGIDVVGPAEALAGVWDALVEAGATPVGAGAFEAARVAAGVPRQGVDIDERTIPQEAFLDRDAVSFTKGCFLGQELVCRIDTRGHVNRYLRGFVMAPGGGDDTTPPPGAGIVWGDKEVGTLTTVARSSAGIRALGYLRREVEVPVDVLVRWDGGEVPARADALPERS